MNQTAALTCLHLGIKVKPVHWENSYMESIKVHKSSTYIMVKSSINNFEYTITLEDFESSQWNYEYEKVIL